MMGFAGSTQSDVFVCQGGSLAGALVPAISSATFFQHPSERHDHAFRNCCRDPSLPGRGGRAPAPDGALGLFRDRHLPARADLQRLGCLRQAALRGDRQARAAWRRRRTGDPHQARQGGRHADDRRHRHRHGPPGADRQSRHRRALGHARLPRAASPRRRTAPA